MSTPLRVLIVDDSEDDASLLVRELQRGGYESVFERVDTPAAMKAALSSQTWDVVISDYSMPHFNGLAALGLVQGSGLDIPFLLVSGAVGEETAVAAMKAGAADYIMKDRLARLIPAVERELHEAQLRQERRQVEKELLDSTHRLDLTMAELSQSQHQVIQQERLTALGQMSSGVAHDFNNALAKILGFNELLLTSPEKLTNPETVKQYLQMINTAAQDAANVVRRLREFYRRRRETEIFEPVDLSALIEQTIALTEPKWKTQAQAKGVAVAIKTELQAVPTVGGNEADLREVLTNLIFNAVDAMPKGGTITIRIRPDGEQVALEVADTGTGMSEEVRRRCLEPFFSTKGEHGTGLGLSIVYGIIQRHKGIIDIQSEVGKGTTFSIRLPFQTGVAATVVKPRVSAPTRPLNVLVVDDEPSLRDIEAEYLVSDGHTVDTASDGVEALQKLRAGRFDLVMADRAMPQMNGDQLAAAIKQFAPKMPVILVTGFGDMMRSNGDKPAGVDLIVPKPFTQATLRKAVEEVTVNCLN